MFGDICLSLVDATFPGHLLHTNADYKCMLIPLLTFTKISIISKPQESRISLIICRAMPTVATFLGLAISGAAMASGAALGAYNVDPNSISVSGLSSGGFMSAQLGVAYSDTFKVGFGVFAGGPYDCARGQSVRHGPNPRNSHFQFQYPRYADAKSSTLLACTTKTHPSRPPSPT